MIAVFDIAGVLADARHREHHVSGRPKDWDAFFAAVGDDPVVEAGRQRLLDESTRHTVVVMSGRPERCRADTEAWLQRHGMGSPRLVLRPDADRRPAAVLKADLVRQVGPPGEVAVVVDDDATVVERLAALGYAAELVEAVG